MRMGRFWIHLKLYVHHLRRGIIPKRWPPRLIELPRGKRLPRHERTTPEHVFGQDGCYRCGVGYWEWFEAPDDIKCRP